MHKRNARGRPLSENGLERRSSHGPDFVVRGDTDMDRFTARLQCVALGWAWLAALALVALCFDGFQTIP